MWCRYGNLINNTPVLASSFVCTLHCLRAIASSNCAHTQSALHLQVSAAVKPVAATPAAFTHERTKSSDLPEFQLLSKHTSLYAQIVCAICKHKYRDMSPAEDDHQPVGITAASQYDSQPVR